MARFRHWRWLVPVLLLAGACWTGNLTLFNYWAAGGPPTAHAELYEHRGNLFLAVTIALLLAAVVVGAINLRRHLHEKHEE